MSAAKNLVFWTAGEPLPIKTIELSRNTIEKLIDGKKIKQKGCELSIRGQDDYLIKRFADKLTHERCDCYSLARRELYQTQI